MLQRTFHVFLIICVTTDLVFARETFPVTVNGSPAFVEGSAGEALFLTPYIENGRIKEGRIASQVGPLLNHSIVSHSGFLTVNKKWNSNLFFWFFLSEKEPETAPLLLWLQGGPGVSTMENLFLENGPYELKPNGQLIRRNYRWTREFNVLYIDQPVGAGFSFTQDERGYVKSQQDVVRDLYPALIQIFQLFSEYLRNDFYISGHSYAGKFIASLAYAIHKRNSDTVPPPVWINLKGLMIGNGLIDPENMFQYGDYLYQLGFIDGKTLTVIREYEDAARRYIRSRQYVKASLCVQKIIAAAKAFPLSAILDYTSVKMSLGSRVPKLFESEQIRKLIHVGNYRYDPIDRSIALHLSEDLMQSVVSLFPELLKHYKILHYSGQLDVIIAYPLTRSFFEKLRFDSADDYYANDLKVWFDDSGVQAGHWKTAGNLTDLLVRKSGHMPSRDQPKWIFDMVTKFIGGEFN